MNTSLPLPKLSTFVLSPVVSKYVHVIVFIGPVCVLGKMFVFCVSLLKVWMRMLLSCAQVAILRKSRPVNMIVRKKGRIN